MFRVIFFEDGNIHHTDFDDFEEAVEYCRLTEGRMTSI
jgi:hypothetical protein